MAPLPFLRRAWASRLGRNIAANYLATAWLGALSLLLIPVYLRLLGADQWGLVALCMTLQAVWGLLDAGLGQLMPRDVARAHADRVALARTYRLYARAYAVLGLAGLALGQLLAGWVAAYWVQASEPLRQQAEWALRLVLLQFLFQFANQASVGYWAGTEQQQRLGWRQCAFATLRHAAALAAVALGQADVLTYLLPFVAGAALEWWLNRRAVLCELGGVEVGVGAAAGTEGLRQVAREAGVLALGVSIGMLVSQLDRIILSRMVDVAALGRYVVVAQLGLALLQLQYPLMRAFFPRIVREQGRGQAGAVRRLTLALLLLCALPCALLAALAPWVLRIWPGDAQVLAEGVVPLRLILVGVALNALYHPIYQRMLACGASAHVVHINLVALALVLALVPTAVPRMGIAAGGLAWVLVGAAQLTLGLGWWARQRRAAG